MIYKVWFCSVLLCFLLAISSSQFKKLIIPLPLPPPPRPPLGPSNLHQQLLILDRNPARQHLHRILKVRVQQDLARAINQRRRRRMQHIQLPAERPLRVGMGRVGREGGVLVAEEHEDVPDAELGREGDRVVEEGEVPAGAVGCGFDLEVLLYQKNQRLALENSGKMKF